MHGQPHIRYRIIVFTLVFYGWSRHRWEDNIKVNLKERGWLGMDSADLAQERDKCQDVVNNGNELSSSLKYGGYRD